MILLTVTGDEGRRPALISVFGAGLLGSSVVAAITSAAPQRVKMERIPLSWSAATLQAQQLEAIEATISSRIQEAGASLKVLWSAGRAGFSATEQETAVELVGFLGVLGMSERLARRFPNTRTTFFLLSSAGGLFEGQRHIDPMSRPQPRRPYGLLKKAQEDLLEASEAPMTKRIYRLTSVYGYLRPNHRSGLISTLILNAVRQRVTHITGHMSTLRDFIFVEDVACFLSRLVLQDEAQEPKTAVLAHAKPYSLFEIQGIVESVLGRRIYVSYSLDPTNREDITFSPAVLPPGWQPSDLRSNISRIYWQAVTSGSAFRRSIPTLDE